MQAFSPSNVPTTGDLRLVGWGATVAMTLLCDWGNNPPYCLCQAVWAVVTMLPKPDVIQVMLMNVITLTVN